MRLRFNLDGGYDYYTMLAMQMRRKRPTWDTCWYWSVFQANGVVLYPPASYVLNTGFDGTGTHGWRSARYMVGGEFTKLPDDVTFPAAIRVREEAYHHVKQKLIAVNKKPFNRLRGLLMRWRRILSG